MADMKITEYNSHNAPATGDQFFMIGTSEEYRIDYDALASAILDKLTTKTYSGISNNVIDAIAALNSRIVQQYKGTGTYASLDPIKPNDERYLGGIIDYVVDTYLQSQDESSTNTYTVSHGGPTFSITLAKAYNNYFCGTVMSYHPVMRSTVWYFENVDGQKCLIPLTPITI